MQPRSRRAVLTVIALLTAASAVGCRRAMVIVPQPNRAYTATDTLWGMYKDNRVRVTFHFDTTYRTDTVVRTDTLYRGGTRTIVRTDTLVRVDTVVFGQSGRIPSGTPTPTRPTTPTPVPVPVPRTRVDTLWRTRVDTLYRGGTVGRVDTVFRVRVDTVRVAGRRTLFVPPGHYPLRGQCRVWIHALPPGRQANAAPCTALGRIPAGAFILFGGDAWDFDYDWIAESRRSSVPPEIIALKR